MFFHIFYYTYFLPQQHATHQTRVCILITTSIKAKLKNQTLTNIEKNAINIQQKPEEILCFIYPKNYTQGKFTFTMQAFQLGLFVEEHFRDLTGYTIILHTSPENYT